MTRSIAFVLPLPAAYFLDADRSRLNDRYSPARDDASHGRRSHVAYTLFEADTDEGDRRLATITAQHLELRSFAATAKRVRNRSLQELDECLGINRRVDQQLFDLVIVGAGPTALAASVDAAREGISVLVTDSVGLGGQAGSSSKIENFIGFLAGISGSDLAGLGYVQALKFGVDEYGTDADALDATALGHNPWGSFSDRSQTLDQCLIFVLAADALLEMGLHGLERLV